MDTPAVPVTQITAGTVKLFGSFHLGEFELALPISALQEVVAFPEAITPVPLAPPHLLGLFNLRGLLIPIVHLGRFLGMPESADRREARVAVIASGDARLAVVFDRTGEMLRLPSSQLVPFRHGGDSLGLIESAFHLDERILQVLSADSLSRLPGLPQVLNPDVAQQERQRRVAQGPRRQAVSFRTSDRHMALAMEAIHEIIRLPVLEHSVLADGCCLGWLDLRGRPVPVIDFADFLQLERRTTDTNAGTEGEDLRRIVVLRQDDAYLGLLVNEVDSIVAYRETQMLPIPAIVGQNGVFAGCISCGGVSADLILIDAPALLAQSSIAELMKGHHDLYLVADDSRRAAASHKQSACETWVTFHLDRLMGLRIHQLCEVVDYDAAMVRPPGAPLHVRGVLNLRQALITVVDLRTLYGMTKTEDLAASKILIVEHGGYKYGLVVDALQNIVSMDCAEKRRIPALVAQQLDAELRHDLREFIELPDQTTVMLMDCESLMQRLTGTGAPQDCPASLDTGA
jgi:purine-binding chemotaxis protein CheW